MLFQRHQNLNDSILLAVVSYKKNLTKSICTVSSLIAFINIFRCLIKKLAETKGWVTNWILLEQSLIRSLRWHAMIIAHVSGSLAFIGHLDGYFQKVSNICAACVFLTRDKKEFL